MKMFKDGTIQDFYTRIGEVSFKDVNGNYIVEVYTDGEFWRVVSVDFDHAAPLIPSAARKLAKLLLKAADVAELEEKRIDAAQAKAAVSNG